MPRTRPIALCLLLAAALSRSAVGADSVSLVDGRTIEGKVSFDAKQGLVVVPRNQSSQRVELKDLLSVNIEQKEQTPKRVAVLVNGARIAADEVLAMSESEVRLKRPTGSLLSFSPILLRSLDFAPDTSLPAPPDSFVGVQTRRGDQSEGEVLGMEKNEVQLSSVLFGIQAFDTLRQVKAVYLRPPGVSRAAYVVKTVDGSTWHAASMKVDNGTLKLTTDTVGTIDLPGNSVVSITLGPAVAETMPGGASFAISPGDRKQISLGKKYRAVLLNLSVPPRYVPNRPVQFVISADGKQIKKTQPITALDGVISVAVSVEDTSSLEIRCAAEGPDALGVVGAVDDARLVRRE